MSCAVVVTSVDAVEVSEAFLMRSLLTVMGDCVIEVLRAFCALIHFSVLHSAIASASILSSSAFSHLSLIALVISSRVSPLPESLSSPGLSSAAPVSAMVSRRLLAASAAARVLSFEFLHFLLRNPDVSSGLSCLVVESSLL